MCAFFTWLLGLRVHTRALVSSGGSFRCVYAKDGEREEGDGGWDWAGLVVLVYVLFGGDGK